MKNTTEKFKVRSSFCRYREEYAGRSEVYLVSLFQAGQFTRAEAHLLAPLHPSLNHHGYFSKHLFKKVLLPAMQYQY
jgi:hypothetical protein